jgi:hypothetical protein
MRSVGKFNYHRGVEWNWLSQFFVLAELKYGEPDVAFRKYLRAQVAAVLDRGGVGGISELFDLSGTRGPEFQAWSMSGFLQALHAFAGVRIDVPERRIVVEPQIPASWPQLSVRKWYGSIPFDLQYTAGGRASGNPHGAREATLRIEFPWGQAPDADIEVGLLLPARRVVDQLEMWVDGEQQQRLWWTEPVSGTDRQRVRFTVPAHAKLELTLKMKRASSRARLTA